MREWTNAHRLTLFVALTFPLSWYPWVIALMRGTTTGPNPLGPFIAALVVAAIAAGKTGVRELLAKLVLWRVSPRAYLVAFGLPILLFATAAAFTDSVMKESIRIAAVPLSDTIERFIVILLFIGLGEEPGWRGLALPELERRHSPLVATLILSCIWALWHLPLIGNEFPPPVVIPFLLSLGGGALVQTWLYHRARGSLLPQMLFHATVNTVGAGLVFRWFSAAGVRTLWWSSAALWLAAGAVAIVATTRAASAAPKLGSPHPSAPRFPTGRGFRLPDTGHQRENQ